MFRRNTDINLTASVVFAVEIVKRILEIRYGFELNYVGGMRISAGDMKKDEGGCHRNLSFETKCAERIQNGKSTKEVLALVSLSKGKDGSWNFSSADIRVIDPDDPSHRRNREWWYHARYAMEHPFDTRLLIGDVDFGPRNDNGFINPVIWRGHGITDRTESLMYPRERLAAK